MIWWIGDCGLMIWRLMIGEWRLLDSGWLRERRILNAAIVNGKSPILPIPNHQSSIRQSSIANRQSTNLQSAISNRQFICWVL
jgi:hypothetical protein